VISEDNLIP